MDRWRDHPNDGRRLGLAAIAAAWFLVIGTQMIFPVMLPHIRSAYGLDLTRSGLLFTTIWFMNAVGTLPGGAIADRVGGVPILVGSMLLAAFGLVLVVTGSSVLFLFGGAATFGVGLSLYGIARFPVIHDLYPNRIGTVTGVTLAASDAGQTLLPPLASLIAVVAFWELGIGFTIPLFVLVTGFLWWTFHTRVPESYQGGHTGSSPNIQYLFGELSRPTIVFGTTVLVLYGIIWATFTSFYPTYLIEMKGLTPTVAGTLFALFFGFGILVKPASGIAYDRLGIRQSLLLVVVVPGFAFALLPVVTDLWALLLVTALASPILGSAAIVQPYVLDVLADDIRGTGLAIVRTIFLLMTAASPLLFGAIADRGYFDEIYYGLAILAVTNVILAVRFPVPSRADSR